MDGMQKWSEEAIQVIKQLRQENQELKEKITMLEKRLRMYENPHTPSSQRRFKGGFKGVTPRGKRGAPKGHRGDTRKTPKPDEVVSVTTDQCPFCGGNPGASQEVETALIARLHNMSFIRMNV